ncbi:hypothetical protein FRB95_007401 [Tulasnella sp. JGI-2019a]|nr:hypothetical protein FRB95_007401 [Tulasnella sp. JGI-2019a]
MAQLSAGVTRLPTTFSKLALLAKEVSYPPGVTGSALATVAWFILVSRSPPLKEPSSPDEQSWTLGLGTRQRRNNMHVWTGLWELLKLRILARLVHLSALSSVASLVASHFRL